MAEFVRVREWPPDYAEKVFAEGYYIEALQTLHGWIERKLRELLLMQRVRFGTSHDNWAKAWDASNEFSLNAAAKALFVLGALSEKEIQDISLFNRARNNLVHKLFHDPYDESWNGVDKADIEKALKIGVALAYEIENKSGEINAEGNPL